MLARLLACCATLFLAVIAVSCPLLTLCPSDSPQVRANLPPGVDGWEVSLQGMMSMVAIGGLIITAIYYGLQRTVVKKIAETSGLRTKKKKQKAKMSVGESFKFLAAST